MKLHSITIKNFKSLKDVAINLSHLTLIAGINSSGKSSLIQALLLMKENKSILKSLSTLDYTQLKKIGFSTSLSSGEYTDLGNNKQWLSYDSSDDNIYFNINAGNKVLEMITETKSDFDLKKSTGEHTLLDLFEDDCFCYLKTDRVPPASDFPFSEEKVNKNLIGLKGEYAAHLLAVKNHHILAIKALKHPESVTEHLLENVSHWLAEISSGVTVSAKTYPELQRASLSYQYEYGGDTTSHLSPLHVGFGLTYVLPVIVAILKSKAGDFIIIENPESHLHPKGQAKIAELCAIAAHHGVQIIVETHSDHFLNGLRVATKKNRIKPEESQIYYFAKQKGELNTQAHAINIDKDGKLDDWPAGFFDEWDNQLDKLLW